MDLPQPDPADRPGRGGVVLTVAGIVALGVLVLAVEPLRTATGDALQGDTEALRQTLRGTGGVALVFALCLMHAVVFYPAEIVNAAAGFVYGFWGALLLVHTGWIVNAIISHQMGRHLARPLLHKLLGAERFDTYERIIERGGISLLLAMRLIPIVPYTLFSYAAGAARVPLWRLTWTSALGYLPLTLLFVYLGTQLEELSATDPILIGGGIALTAAVLLGRVVQKKLESQARSHRAAEQSRIASSAND